MQMTDGYNIKVSIDIVSEQDWDSSNTNGMCFGSDPSTNGGYCLTWVGIDDDSTSLTKSTIKHQGFNVQFIPATSWSSRSWPGSSTGTILTPANSGITYYPDTTQRATCPSAANCAGCIAAGNDCWPILDVDGSGVGETDEDEPGMAIGATIWAKWYMPTEADEYTDLNRIGSGDTL